MDKGRSGAVRGGVMNSGTDNEKVPSRQLRITAKRELRVRERFTCTVAGSFPLIASKTNYQNHQLMQVDHLQRRKFPLRKKRKRLFSVGNARLNEGNSEKGPHFVY